MVDAVCDPAVYRAGLCFLLQLPMGIAGFVLAVTALAVGLGLSVTLVGIPIIAAALIGARQVGAAYRQLARWGFGAKIARPGPLARGPGFLGWLQGVLLDAASWRSLLYVVLMFPMGVLCGVVAVGLIATAVLSPVLVAAPWIVRALTAANRWLAERLLAPVTLSERARRSQERRRQVVESAADERRRIERDLHDGAQARLVALAMDLGMAKEKLAGGSDPDRAATLVASAHEEVKRALSELRDLTRGIHPAVLADRGLDAALSAVAARCSVPVAVSVEAFPRPPQAVEQIAYYCVAELLVNVSRHSQATAAAVTVRHLDDLLLIDVRDDGVGGADPNRGTGLRGLAERVESAGGGLVVDSPTGGPTIVNVELPCGS
jgi:signal transduction histidine kinase